MKIEVDEINSVTVVPDPTNYAKLQLNVSMSERQMYGAFIEILEWAGEEQMRKWIAETLTETEPQQS